MITPSFSLTATERVLPKLALDFTTASLDSRVTFTRTTGASNPATYTNSFGYIVSATNNQPRFDYNPITLSCNGLLIEEQRTNLALYSEQFDSSWIVIGAVTPNTTIAPSGQTTADTGTTNGASFQAFQGVTISSGATVTGSVYLKQNEINSAEIVLLSNNNTTPYARSTFNVSTGVISVAVSTANGGTNASSAITNVGNGWYRCSVTVTYPAVTAAGMRINAPGATGSIYLWGAQLEAGAFATSYIPTTTTALTRNADVATMTGTNFSDWWTATTGAAEVAVIPSTVSGTRPLIQFDDNTSTNQICLRGSGGNPELYIKATTDQAQIDAGTITANTSYKLTGAWNTNDCAAAQNGASPVTDNAATIPTVSQARIGSDGTNYANAWLQKINYWPQRITNAEVQAFSK